MALAQTPYIPPDYYGDSDKGAVMIRSNFGQVLGTDLQQRPEVFGYIENSPIGIYLSDRSRVSFRLAQIHHDSIIGDTVYRIDLKLTKDHDRDPVFLKEAPGLSNYYLGDLAVEGVPANYRGVYASVGDSIDAHIYGSKGGPRMAYVVRPGGDPGGIELTFSGQDSIKVDWQGALNLYVGQQWIRLEEAIAYQVDGNDLVQLAWTPAYDHTDGEVTVKFDFEDYDEELPLVFQIGYPDLLMGGGELDNLTWCTYSSSYDGDQLECVEVDETGDPYFCGYTYQDYFPIAIGTIVFPPQSTTMPGGICGLTMRINHESKQIQWANYIGGTIGAGTAAPRTEARKLAVYTGPLTDHQYVFVTGSTSCLDFQTISLTSTIFENATNDPYGGGRTRAWIAAFNKLNGELAWSNTHGEPDEEYTWGEHGLSVAVNDEGTVIMCGMIEAYFWTSVTPNFQTVTPSGAFTRPLGDGFFIVYDEDYQIEWSTTFCEFSENAGFGRLNDVRLVQDNNDHTLAWLVGASVEGSQDPLDLVAPTLGGYYQTSGGQPSAVVAVVDLEDHDVVYCTRWGSPSGSGKTEAHGIHIGEEGVDVVGFTDANDFTTTELPAPTGGTGAQHATTNASNQVGQPSDGFILRFKGPFGNFPLNYGTLYGGNRDDVLIDVNGDGDGYIYITGETRSHPAFQNYDPDLYYRQSFNYVDRRDAMILRIADAPYPAMNWRTAFGGRKSDRGWGIAATPYEMYLCGATSSSHNPWDEFPLHEFDTGSELDWYYDFYYGGTSTEFAPWCAYNLAMDYESGNIDDYLEGLNLGHDGFIASFQMQEQPVGFTTSDPEETSQLTAWPDRSGNGWWLALPSEGSWTIDLFDATGRTVCHARTSQALHLLTGCEFASGVYVIRAVDQRGSVVTTKISQP